MCLLVLAWRTHPRYRLIVAANRDEYHERPTAPLSLWALPTPAGQAIAAGRDLRAGGTWLAVDRGGRFGAVTNFREPSRAAADAPSRGDLIPAYLRSPRDLALGQYLQALAPRASAYAGFNLLLGAENSLWYASNRIEAPFARPLEPGVYGLSNGLLDTPWPKLSRVRERFEQALAHGDPDPQGLLALLYDRNQAHSAADLPLTGIDPAWEQTLSSPFVVHPMYGTRSSTVLLQGLQGTAVHVIERTFDRTGAPTGTSQVNLAQ